MGLFGNKENKEDKAARQSAAAVEAERLCGLSRRDLALELVEAFRPADSKAPRLNDLQVAMWALRSFDAKTSLYIQLRGPIASALHLLESADVTVRTVLSGGGYSSLTRNGEAALAGGTVGEMLTPT